MTVQEQLENAAKNGQLDAIKELFRIHKNEVTPDLLNNIFIEASRGGHLEVVKYLLTLDNPKVNYSASNDWAFKWAAHNGHLEVVKHLLTLGNPKVDYRVHNELAFRMAATNGHLEVVKHLLTLDNPKVDYRAKNDEAFRGAAANGHLEVVKHLLTLDNPKVNYRAENDEAFRWAAGNGHLEVVKHLLTLDNPKVDYGAEDDEAFQRAAQNGHLEVVRHLLTLPNIDPSVNNFQAVVWALENQHLPVVESIARWVRAHGTTAQRNRLDEILGNRGVVINYEQSTHAASVHKSVSESANRLMARYGDAVEGNKLRIVLEQMLTYVNGLASSRESIDCVRAAQQYLAGQPTEAYPTSTGNVISPQEGSRFLFVDPGSNVTTQQILALTYLAAQDDKAHPDTSVEDALQSFVRGLYEARRGYNLNDKGQDNQLADRMICPPGAFNKAIEVLAAVHPDCEIVLVTKTQASLKLPKVAEEEAFEYLDAQLKEATSASSLESFMALLSQVQSEGMSVIVPKVKDKIGDRLFEEFGSVYSDNREHENFKALVDNAEYIPVNETKLSSLLGSAKTRLENLEPKEKQPNTSRAILPVHSRRARHTELYSDSSDDEAQRNKGPRTK